MTRKWEHSIPALNAATMMTMLCHVRNHHGWERTLGMVKKMVTL